MWGSWYDVSSGTWGYACCHSNIHISYCAGEAGKEAQQASTAQALLASSSSTEAEPPVESKETRARIEQNYSKKRVGEGDISLDKDRLAEAISEEKKRKAWGEKDDDRFSKKRKGLQSGSHDVTEEEYGMCLSSDIGHQVLMSPHRGLSNDSSKRRRSHGELRGQRSVLMYIYDVFLLYLCCSISFARSRRPCCPSVFGAIVWERVPVNSHRPDKFNISNY